MLGKSYRLLLGVLLLGGALLAGCGGSGGGAMAQSGDIVSVDYTGKLEDGSIFDTSIGKQPLQFTLGEGNMISGFEKAVTGMKVGESKTVTLTPEEAYGPRNEDLVVIIERDNLPEDIDPAVGEQLVLKTATGTEYTVTVIEVEDTAITVDANFILAGKTLIFEIRLVAIE